MPSPHEILDGLTAIANRGLGVALAWHAIVAATLLGLAVGWRPSQRTAQGLIALPLASVAVVAFIFGNPFNGAVFAVGTLALVAGALGRDRPGAVQPVRRGGPWTFAAAVAMLAFAWAYPHFLAGSPAWYLIAAPLGLIPCPSLAAAIGFALLGGGFGSRAWSRILASLGLCYGLFGALRLGVLLDVGLVLGAALLLVVSLRNRQAQPESATLGRDVLNRSPGHVT